MKRMLLIILLLCIVGAVSLSAGIITEESNWKPKVDDLQRDNQELQSTITELKTECNQWQTQYNELDDEYNQLDTKYKVLEVDYAALEEALEGATTPSLDHALTLKEIWKEGNCNEDRTYSELKTIAQAIAGESYSQHEYIEGEYDCNDMSVEIWNRLHKEGIKGFIGVGDRNDSLHAWVIILTTYVKYLGAGTIIAIETTNSMVYCLAVYSFNLVSSDSNYEGDTSFYGEGLYYDNPSTLREDAKYLW